MERPVATYRRALSARRDVVAAAFCTLAATAALEAARRALGAMIDADAAWRPWVLCAVAACAAAVMLGRASLKRRREQRRAENRDARAEAARAARAQGADRRAVLDALATTTDARREAMRPLGVALAATAGLYAVAVAPSLALGAATVFVAAALAALAVFAARAEQPTRTRASAARPSLFDLRRAAASTSGDGGSSIDMALMNDPAERDATSSTPILAAGLLAAGSSAAGIGAVAAGAFGAVDGPTAAALAAAGGLAASGGFAAARGAKPAFRLRRARPKRRLAPSAWADDMAHRARIGPRGLTLDDAAIAGPDRPTVTLEAAPGTVIRIASTSPARRAAALRAVAAARPRPARPVAQGAPSRDRPPPPERCVLIDGPASLAFGTCRANFTLDGVSPANSDDDAAMETPIARDARLLHLAAQLDLEDKLLDAAITMRLRDVASAASHADGDRAGETDFLAALARAARRLDAEERDLLAELREPWRADRLNTWADLRDNLLFDGAARGPIAAARVERAFERVLRRSALEGVLADIGADWTLAVADGVEAAARAGGPLADAAPFPAAASQRLRSAARRRREGVARSSDRRLLRDLALRFTPARDRAIRLSDTRVAALVAGRASFAPLRAAPKDRRGRGAGDLDVHESLAAALIGGRPRGDRPALAEPARRAIRRALRAEGLEETVARAGLGAPIDSVAWSGADLERLALARAIAARPALIALDGLACGESEADRRLRAAALRLAPKAVLVIASNARPPVGAATARDVETARRGLRLDLDRGGVEDRDALSDELLSAHAARVRLDQVAAIRAEATAAPPPLSLNGAPPPPSVVETANEARRATAEASRAALKKLADDLGEGLSIGAGRVWRWGRSLNRAMLDGAKTRTRWLTSRVKDPQPETAPPEQARRERAPAIDTPQEPTIPSRPTAAPPAWTKRTIGASTSGAVSETARGAGPPARRSSPAGAITPASTDGAPAAPRSISS